LAANLELQFKEIGNLTVDRATLIEYVYKDKWLKVGKVVFKKNCVSCHGKEGQGLVGPNLRDEQYKNVTDIGDILTVLEKGANAGAMPAWKNRLSDNELLLVSSYVASLRGSGTVGGERAPEGRDIPPWPDKPAEQEPQPAEVGATDDRMADAKRADEEAAETKSDSGEQ
jgi:cytochrome c oxidase cbb3-type subunit 3